MADHRLTPLVETLPSTVPFVGPETQERSRGRPFRARIGAIQEFLSRLPYPDKDEAIARRPDPLIVGPVATMLPLEGRFMFAEGQAMEAQ